MSKVCHVASNAAGVTISSGTTRYMFPGNSGLNPNATESARQITWRAAGTVSNLRVLVITNTTTASSTFRTRKNSANGGLSVTIGAGATGLFEDTSGSDTLAAGDTFGYQVVGGTGGSMVITVVATDFDATTDRSMIYCNGTSESRSDTATKYSSLACGDETSSGEANAQTQMGVAGTAKNYYLKVTANPRTGDSIFTLRKNGVDTAITITVPASTTGTFEDTTHTVTVAAGDKLAFGHALGAGAGAFTWCGESLQYDTVSQYQTLASLSGTGAIAAGITRYLSIGGDTYSATEANVLARLKITEDVQKLYAYVGQNSLNTGTTTLTLRDGGVATNLSLSIAAAATGWHTDTDSHSFTTADDASYELVTSGSSGTIRISMISVVFGTSVAALVEPGHAALTYTGYAPTVLTPRVVVPGVATLTYTGYAPNVEAGTTVKPGVAALVFTGYAPTVIAAVAAQPGHAALTYTGYAPVVLTPRVVQPGVAALTFTGYAPDVLTPRAVIPGVATLTYTGYAPGVSAPAVFRPGVAALVFTGYPPFIALPQASIPGHATLTYTGYAPTVLYKLWQERTSGAATWSLRSGGAASWSERTPAAAVWTER